jgi:cytochrome c-type biogenesis protein CcmH/NrfG
MTDLRKAAEMALEALETLWGILDDIDTASDMAKENDAWYRKRVEALQKKRWDTMITTDGHKLKGGPVEALRQALAQEEQEPVGWGSFFFSDDSNPHDHVDTVTNSTNPVQNPHKHKENT